MVVTLSFWCSGGHLMAVEGGQARFVHTKLHPKNSLFLCGFFFLCTFCGQKSGWHKEGTPLWSSMCLFHLYARTRKEDVYILMQVFWEDFFQWKCLISKGFKDTKTNKDDKQRHSRGDNRKYIVAQLRMTKTDDNNRTHCCKVVEINS